MDEQVKTKIETYPLNVRPMFLSIRQLIYQIAEDESLGEVVESLKWGEPSYQSKSGSAVRIDWKKSSPSCLSLYFHCQTSLVDTFKQIYPDTFHFIGNREIALACAQEVPVVQLQVCLSMALRYHKIKHLSLLGS